MRITPDLEDDWDRLLGPRQITLSTLMAPALKQGGRSVSLVQRRRLDLVKGAGAGNLVIFEPA